MAPYENQGTRSRIRRSPSDTGIDPDEADRIADQARKEAERDLLLSQLGEKVDCLSRKMDTVKGDIHEVKSSLKEVNNKLQSGNDRMDDIESQVEDLETDIKQHETDRKKAEQERSKAWNNVFPNLITSVVSTLITASMLGGIAYSIMAGEKNDPEVRYYYVPYDPDNMPPGGRYGGGSDD